MGKFLIFEVFEAQILKCRILKWGPPLYSTDFCHTKTAVCVLARSSGESNAREWGVSVRVSRGLSV